MSNQQEEKKINDQIVNLYQISPEKLQTATIKGYDFNKGINFDDLMKSYETFGLQATNLHLAIENVNKMINWRLTDEPIDLQKDSPDFLTKEQRDKVRCTIFLGYTSNMISSGNREIIRYLVQHKMIDVIVTSAGGIEEDLMKCLANFHVGSWQVDDKQCRLKAINRIGNIFVPSENYAKLEDWLVPIFKEMYQQQQQGKIWSPQTMIKYFGEKINNEDSVYYWAAKNDIPVFCPALTDGAIGDMMFYFNYKQEGLICDILQDIITLNKIALRAKKSGLIILGGGVIKHHILNANIWRNGADYAVFINTGIEYDGSDAGAKPSEGISWGKLQMNSDFVKVFAEASLVFPLLVAQSFAKQFDIARKI